jgi:putative spermidine/putrescine transport system ATP-binding protein
LAFLELQELDAGYSRSRPVLERFSLAVEKGELVSLLGPSGCGKTTTLRVIAGFLEPFGGRLLIGGRDTTRVPPHRRNIGLVFQSYALFPHLSVAANVAFGLRMRRVAAGETRERVAAALAMVDLEGLEERLPSQLSGGQRQRVALARALVIEPDLLLLDEPLSNLDAKLRVGMRAELTRLQRRLGITMVYVTHDQVEALSLSDRIVVMNRGRIEQSGPPERIYREPATPFVAGFMGFDNRFDARVAEVRGASVRLAAGSRTLEARLRTGWQPRAGDAVQVYVRPEAVGLAPTARPEPNSVPGEILFRTFQGSSLQYFVRTELGELTINVAGAHTPWPEGPIAVVLPAESLMAGLEEPVREEKTR